MSAIARTRARRVVSRITATWSDLDYANRRLLEIQTGVSGLTRENERRSQVADPFVATDEVLALGRRPTPGR